MSRVVNRLGAFTLLLAGTFGTAYAVGEALPGHSHTNTDDHTDDDHTDDDHTDDTHTDDTHNGDDPHDQTEMDMGGPVTAGFENGGYQLVTDGIGAGVVAKGSPLHSRSLSHEHELVHSEY